MNTVTNEISKACSVIPGKMALPNQYFAGRVGSRFIISLRDSRKILGVKCPKCKTVYVPPMEYCQKDLTKIDENWVDLGDTGVLVNYTVVNYRDAHLPRKIPYILGMIQMDGAEATLVHLVEGVDPQNVKIGMRVKVVFAGKTTNTILDIDHFEPVEE